MKIIFLLLLISTLVLPKDTLKVHATSNPKDTIVIVHEGYGNNYNAIDPTFLEKYQTLIGAFFGSLLAAGIALFSIWKTNRNQKKLNDEANTNQVNLQNEKLLYIEKKDKLHYRGILITISSILISHKFIIDELIKELEALLNDFKKRGRLAYEKPHTFISIDLLKTLIIKFVEYKNYNIRVLFNLSGYIISIDNLYNDLDFQPINNLKEEDYFEQKMESYFIQLNGRVNELNKKSEEIGKMIEVEINNLFGATADIIEKIQNEDSAI